MGQRKYSEEFKAEAVRQVVDRGYRVADVAARVGVSPHSLYKWTRAARPTKAEQQSEDLDAANAQIAKLKADLKRAEEERDILKNDPPPLRAAPIARETRGAVACLGRGAWPSAYWGASSR